MMRSQSSNLDMYARSSQTKLSHVDAFALTAWQSFDTFYAHRYAPMTRPHCIPPARDLGVLATFSSFEGGGKLSFPARDRQEYLRTFEPC
jgi:hypothetical protein